MDRFNLGDDDFLELADVYKIMGSETRLKIVCLLADGERSVGEISEAIGMNASAVSHQLKELKLHKLISCRKSGQNVHYRLCDHHVLNILEAAVEHIRGDNCEESDADFSEGRR